MAETIARLHIALSGTEPLIWRVIDVPVDASLKMIHDTIQAAMGWLDYHLWEFEDGVRRYGLPDPEWPDDDLVAARNVKLRTLLKRGIERLDYLYDMGDNWHHVITIEGIEDGVTGTKYPRYVGGAGRAPPEDVGGTDGFRRFLEAIADPRHRDRKEMVEWHRECYGIDYDPETLDEFAIKLGIGAIAKRRAAGKAAASKRK